MSISDPPKHYRCSKGHEWEQTPGIDRIIVIDKGPFCLRCIAEFIEGHMGTVEEVPEVKPIPDEPDVTPDAFYDAVACK